MFLATGEILLRPDHHDNKRAVRVLLVLDTTPLVKLESQVHAPGSRQVTAQHDILLADPSDTADACMPFKAVCQKMPAHCWNQVLQSATSLTLKYLP